MYWRVSRFCGDQAVIDSSHDSGARVELDGSSVTQFGSLIESLRLSVFGSVLYY